MPVVRISDDLFKEVQKYAEPLVDNFESALWKIVRLVSGNQVIRQSKPSKPTELTPPKAFWRPILEVLVENGGQADVQTVVKALEVKLKNQLRPGDWESNVDGSAKWVKQVNFQRLAMKHEGLIADNSPSGTWAITEQGKRWLSRQSAMPNGKQSNVPESDTEALISVASELEEPEVISPGKRLRLSGMLKGKTSLVEELSKSRQQDAERGK